MNDDSVADAAARCFFSFSVGKSQATTSDESSASSPNRRRRTRSSGQHFFGGGAMDSMVGVPTGKEGKGKVCQAPLNVFPKTF